MKLQTKRRIDKYFGYWLIFFLLPVTRLLGILLRRDHSLQREPGTIVFIKLMGLGSLVLAADAIEATRRRYPRARLVLLSEENIANGIGYFSLFDETWCIRTRSLRLMICDSLKYILKSWRTKDLWVIDLEVYSKLTTVYSLLTMARNRFGFFLGAVFFRKYLNTHNVFFNQFIPLEDNYHQVAVAAGAGIVQRRVPSQREEELEKPFIAINNTCSALAPVRKMEPRMLVQVCAWLLENTAYSLAFLGTADDAAANGLVIAELPPGDRIINLAGKKNFTSYYRFLEEECAFIITIDSAPLHIAKKLGLPTISAWGPTNPSAYLSISETEKNRHLVCYNKVPCSPCVHHFEKLPCRGNNTCMKDMQASEVISKVRQLLFELDFSQRKETDSPVFI